MYDIEKVYQATSVDDAIKYLVANTKSVIIAGGSDVLIKIRESKLAGCSLVSIRNLDELRGISKEADGSIKIGAISTFTDITYHHIIQENIPVLGEAVDQVGGPQVRNIGTIGGNISNGVTSADSASTLFALNAEVELKGPDGVRRIPIHEYYIGPGKVDLKVGELLTFIYIKQEDYVGYFGHYIKYAMRNAMDIATLGCSVVCKLSSDLRKIQDLRIAYGVAGPIPMRCKGAEQAIQGMEINEELLNTLGKKVLEEVNPRDSWRASKVLRIQLAEELSKRALREAIRKAGGEI